MSAQHTPTPWVVAQGAAWPYLGAPRPGNEARLDDVFALPEAEANVEFAARAVNSHDKLLAALEEALPALSALALEEKRRNARVVKEVAKYTAQQSYANAVAAIAEAKGEA